MSVRFMKHQRGWSVLLCFLMGCSTHPLADVCDYLQPGKMGPNKVQPYGGTAAQQGVFLPQTPSIQLGVPAVPPPPGAPVVPPPAPLPGSPPLGVSIQPPQPIPPIPPAPPPNFGR